MNVFLSCVSTEFKSYRLRLANQLGALKDHPYEIKVQEDFQQGGFTLLAKLADYIRDSDLVIHLAGDACGARPFPPCLRTFASTPNPDHATMQAKAPRPTPCPVRQPNLTPSSSATPTTPPSTKIASGS